MSKQKIVLLIDDDEDDRILFSEALKEIDTSIQYITATNGQEGLMLLANETILPDFIFLDLNMPCMSGKECLIEIRKNPEWDHIPVIIYSTTKRPEDEIEMKKMGAACFITKPVLFDDICAAIVYVLERKWEKNIPF